MRFPFLLGLLAGVAIALIGIAAISQGGGSGGAKVPVPAEPSALPTSLPTGLPTGLSAGLSAGYSGSAACAECHPKLHQRWQASAHARSIRDFSAETAAKPFDGETYISRDIEHRLGPGAFMECEGPGGKMQKFPVDRVIGGRRIQMFLTPMDKGRIQVLPVFVEVPSKLWFDYTDFIFGKPDNFEIPPDSPDSWYTFARNFNSRCVMCHALDAKVGYDPDTGEYDTKWKELTVACESCHGPGQAHTQFHREKRRGKDPITNPSRLDTRRADMVCGQCHAEAEHIDPGYRPGDDLFRFIDPAGLEDAKHLHPDGRARELIHDLIPTLMSRCESLSCVTCHDPHGRGVPGLLRAKGAENEQCIKCHQDTPEHSNHTPTSEGSKCVNCHMPRMVIEGGHGRVFDHTMSIPSIENTKRFGLPNACRQCHLLEDPGFEYEPFAKWYPDADKKNHRVALARTIAAGRQGKGEPDLRALAKDINELYRAGAVRLLAGMNADVEEFLDDTSPLVKRAAIAGAPAKRLVLFLNSDNAVLRYRAALRLATMPPIIDALLIVVLEEFAEMRSDQVAIHMALGRLYERTSDWAKARIAYGRYLRINPWDKSVEARIKALPK